MKSVDLGNEKTWNSILKLALPAMLAQLVNVLYNIVDRIYVGNIPSVGSISLIGLGVCAPITTLITSFGYLIGLGGAPLFSIALGEKNPKKAKEILSNAFLMLLIVSALIMLTFYLSMDKMLYAFGASKASFPYAKTYLTFFLIGTFFSIVSTGLIQFLTAQGYSLFAMLSVLSACVLNVILDPLFIFTLGLGVKGAAIATVISQFLSFSLALYFLLRKATVPLSFGSYSISTDIKILKLGFSPFIIMASDSLILILLNSVLAKTGGEQGDFYIEVATIVQAFESLVTGPLLGISSGTQPVLGYNYGAKNVPLIKKAEKQIMMFGFFFTVFCFALSFLLSRPFSQMFVGFSNAGSQSEAIVDASVRFIRIYMFGIIPLSFQYVFVDGLTGMGQAKYSIWLSLNRKLVIYVPSLLLLAYFTKDPSSCFYAELIADVLSGLVTSIVYFILIPKIFRKRLAEKDEDIVLVQDDKNSI
ncbi:MAG: MATE family efflux transporter [Bacilli bacterium]